MFQISSDIQLFSQSASSKLLCFCISHLWPFARCKRLSMNSLSMYVYVAFLSLLHVQRGRGDTRLPQVPCKEGKFFEDSVSDYLNCSVCVKQVHYSNCDLCCASKLIYLYHKLKLQVCFSSCKNLYMNFVITQKSSVGMGQ